jgi:hypothetical protein
VSLNSFFGVYFTISQPHQLRESPSGLSTREQSERFTDGAAFGGGVGCFWPSFLQGAVRLRRTRRSKKPGCLERPLTDEGLS